jgi:hypothetical protein
MGDAVVDVHHAGKDAGSLEEKLWRGVWIGDEADELDAQEGDLRVEALELNGAVETLLL